VSQTELSFTSLVLAAVSSNDTVTSQNNTDPNVQGLVLQAPPIGANTNSSAASAAWLASGYWLVPQALLSQAACSSGGPPAATAAAAVSLSLHNVTMLVDPQSLARIQQALSTAAAAAAIPSSLEVIQVRAAYMANDLGLHAEGQPGEGVSLQARLPVMW
jgi:hypothetical protein